MMRMNWTRISKWMCMAACGGMLLQATGGCASIVTPLIGQLATSVILNLVLGLIGGAAT